MLLFLLDLVVRAGPTPPPPEGGRDLERDRCGCGMEGEGVWRVKFGWKEDGG
jgi:hypothetical protein